MPPGGALRVAFDVDPGWERLEARLLVDGRDVTDACGLRVAPTQPPRRVELVYAPPGGWTTGGHEAAVLVPGARPERWRFTAE